LSLSVRPVGRRQRIDILLGRAIYPAVFSASFVVALHTDAWVPAEALVRPLLVVVLATLVLQAAATLLSRDSNVGAYVTLLALVALLEPIIAVWGIALGGMLVAVRVWRRRGGGGSLWPSVTRGLNVFAVAFSLVTLFNSGVAGSLAWSGRGEGPTGDAAPGSPDIYLILLDGYPRADSLLNEFGIDNEPFLAEMSAEGFEVGHESRSNYNITQLTLASMLNYRHVLELAGSDRGAAPIEQARSVTRSINNARVLDDLWSRGYEVLTIPSPFSATTLYSSNAVLDSGQLNDFEMALIDEMWVTEAMPDIQRTWLAAEHRQRVRQSFEMLAALAGDVVDHPRFILAHVMAPHPPLLFGPDGEERMPFECFPTTCEFWDSGWRYGAQVLGASLRAQLTYVNQEILRAVMSIRANSAQEPVIVIFSDHGYRHGPHDRSESVRSLLMASTPGHADLFPNDATPVNILPRLLNAYFDADLPLAREDSYWVDWRTLRTRGILALESADD
jgi:hypothetical protein